MTTLPKSSPPAAHAAASRAQLWQWFRLALCLVAVHVAVFLLLP